jgi:general stress protein CsbA
MSVLTAVFAVILYGMAIGLALAAVLKIAKVKNGIEKRSFVLLLGAIAWAAGMDLLGKFIPQADSLWWQYIAWLPVIIALGLMNLLMLGYFEE